MPPVLSHPLTFVAFADAEGVLIAPGILPSLLSRLMTDVMRQSFVIRNRSIDELPLHVLK